MKLYRHKGIEAALATALVALLAGVSTASAQPVALGRTPSVADVSTDARLCSGGDSEAVFRWRSRTSRAAFIPYAPMSPNIPSLSSTVSGVSSVLDMVSPIPLAA